MRPITARAKQKPYHASVIPLELLSYGGASMRRGKSFYRGVSEAKSNNRWEANIGYAGRQIYLGTFGTEKESAERYDLASLILNGKGGFKNFPLNHYTPEQIQTMKDFIYQRVRH